MYIKTFAYSTLEDSVQKEYLKMLHAYYHGLLCITVFSWITVHIIVDYYVQFAKSPVTNLAFHTFIYSHVIIPTRTRNLSRTSSSFSLSSA